MGPMKSFLSLVMMKTKDKMVDGLDEYKDEGLDVQSFVIVKNNQSRTYNLLESDNKSYVSLIDYEMDVPQVFDPWNKTQSQVLNADQVEDATKDFMKKMKKDYSFYTKGQLTKSLKTTREYKDTLEGKRTYVKHGDEYTLTTYDKGRKAESRITRKRLSKSDSDKRWDDYKDAVRIIRKELKSYSGQYDDFKTIMVMVTVVIMEVTMEVTMVTAIVTTMVDSSQTLAVAVKER